ncbi:MAG: NADPH:quinone reductase [Armatimonadota bacterium]|nr:NADPH:quinone reductase [Armatimonadota bacterium]
MKAIQVHEYGGPEVMQLEEVPDLQPGPGQVVVRIHAAGVNPVDTYIRAGAYGRLTPPPYTPGSDAAGVIEAVGEGVQDVKVGDRVYTAGTLSGAYATMALCNSSQVHPLLESLSFSQGAAIGVPYGTAYRALFTRAGARPGEVVLVHGATGGVGIAACQLARAAGLTVIGTGGTDRGRQLALEQGAHFVFDHRAPDYLEHIKKQAGSRGVTLILEMLANVNLSNDLGLLAKGGRVVIIGNRGKIEIDPRTAMMSELNILGMTLNNATPDDIISSHAALSAGFENGSLRPIVGQKIPLAEAPRAHVAVMESGAFGKIVLVA